MDAMVAHECAAKIACYQGDEQATRQTLALADLTNAIPRQCAMDKILLSKLDMVLEISRKFYSNKRE